MTLASPSSPPPPPPPLSIVVRSERFLPLFKPQELVNLVLSCALLHVAMPHTFMEPLLGILQPMLKGLSPQVGRVVRGYRVSARRVGGKGLGADASKGIGLGPGKSQKHPLYRLDSYSLSVVQVPGCYSLGSYSQGATA